MNSLKICVYAICKNEAKFVDEWMDSMGEADLVVVTDTGSTDDTVEKLRARGAVVHVNEVKPWRFDKARNISLDHVPEDTDICICTDLDELFNAGWRKNLEEAWLNHQSSIKGPTAKCGRYLYNWSLKPDGSPDVQFVYFKVHERKDFSWKCPVHEYVSYDGPLPLEKIFIEGMVLSHYPDAEKSRGSYLPLLEMAVEEDPDSERMRYYLGREYMYKGHWQNAIDTLIYFLNMPSATWREERCAAMRWIAKSYHSLNDKANAYRWYYKAIGEAPHLRDPYVEFATMCNDYRDWPAAYFLLQEALKITEKSNVYVNMGYSWDHTPHDLCAIAAFNIGLVDISLEHAKKAYEIAPDIERLKNNITAIEKVIESKKL
ncbi:tetratricopeptide repeat-containing glycosyltransferase [Anaeropeptidivorans aminofermentans]|jgi:glycosyltransferase involved in cell wall biosynthesis|uniref:tetratricopeptide repeat-containing glycosyltransferase n=1 Tax=Anaeropeptidivorans aminofermentans TaxID=2934315 RepID=UPI00202521DD|nr:glycosyltransferase [Anaeropeptidivorans aminofermentans]MBE6011100.1 glycosyltransferase [Lachnospiraceae bacterium]